MSSLSDSQRRFAAAAVRKKRLFLGLSVAGILVAAGLAADTVVRRWRDPGFSVGGRTVIVLLVLLNARQNLRQHRYAAVLEELSAREDC